MKIANAIRIGVGGILLIASVSVPLARAQRFGNAAAASSARARPIGAEPVKAGSAAPIKPDAAEPTHHRRNWIIVAVVAAAVTVTAVVLARRKKTETGCITPIPSPCH